MKDKDTYTGGLLLVDHYSNFIYVLFQSHLNIHETLASKEEYEAFCCDHSVSISQYQSDNGSSFMSQTYMEQLHEFRQITSFADVGAHHHNGKAETSIHTITQMARTMMLHAGIH